MFIIFVYFAFSLALLAHVYRLHRRLTVGDVVMALVWPVAFLFMVGMVVWALW